jgi:predicted nuclease of predicted toxin-antitoxin system
VRFLIDMNFGVAWTERLRALGLDATHWSDVGAPRAADDVIVAWVAQRGFVLLTRDLDPASIVTTSGRTAPSVIQVRYADVMLAALPSRVAAAAHRHALELQRGAIVVLDARTGRTRVRPLKRR